MNLKTYPKRKSPNYLMHFTEEISHEAGRQVEAALGFISLK